MKGYGCVDRQSPLTDVHHLARDLCLAIYPEEDRDGHRAAIISPVISNNQTESRLQDAPDQALGQRLGEDKVWLNLEVCPWTRIPNSEGHRVPVGWR